MFLLLSFLGEDGEGFSLLFSSDFFSVPVYLRLQGKGVAAMDKKKQPTRSADSDSGYQSRTSGSERSRDPSTQTSDEELGPSGTKSADELWALVKEITKFKGPDYLKGVSGFVSKHRKKTFPLKKPAGARLRIGGLEDTDYSKKELNGWGRFYLPKIVNMEVVGVVGGTSCPCDQLVLMTCEDRKLYAFDGEEEELHMVAESLEELSKKGLRYPSSESYYKGEAFRDMTEEDWAKVKKGAVGQKLEAEHRKLVEQHKPKLLEKLRSAKAAV